MTTMMNSSSSTGNSGNGNFPIEAYLSSVTDAVIVGRNIPSSWAKRYDLSPSEAASWLALIRGLSGALVLVKPSKTYAESLKRDLIGRVDRTMVERVRQLPPRVQIAATLAVAAGLWLLARRRYATLAATVEGVTDENAADIGILAQ